MRKGMLVLAFLGLGLGLGCAYPDVTFGDGIAPKSTAMPACEGREQGILLLTDRGVLHLFQPETLTVQRVATLDCPTTEYPWSMAVDHAGTAWVLYEDGRIHKASTKDGHCEVTPFVPDQQGFHLFGMAFAGDGDGHETLFVSDGSGSRLGRIDTETLALTPVGSFGMERGASDLTGTSSGQLYALFKERTPVIAELDVHTGAITRFTSLPGISLGSWAIAHWGTDVWLFTENGSSSHVRRFESKTNRASDSLATLGFTVVGAGVASCDSPR